MPNGVRSGDLSNLPSKKHLRIRIPGENKVRIVYKENSLLFLAHTIERYFVKLIGFSDDYVSITSLSDDVLQQDILCYRIDGPETFSCVIPCTGYHFFIRRPTQPKSKNWFTWKGDINDNENCV